MVMLVESIIKSKLCPNCPKCHFWAIWANLQFIEWEFSNIEYLTFLERCSNQFLWVSNSLKLIYILATWSTIYIMNMNAIYPIFGKVIHVLMKKSEIFFCYQKCELFPLQKQLEQEILILYIIIILVYFSTYNKFKLK